MSSVLGGSIAITGGAGFLGRAIGRGLRARRIPESRVFVPRRRDYDLTTAKDCARLYAEAFDGRPVDVLIHLAAEVGGIGANRANPGRYFYANMAMALHLIEEFRRAGLIEHGSKFVQVGTVCAYPERTPVPFREDRLWDGFPEATNAPYGVAKRAAWQMLDAYARQYGMRSAYVLPVNLYGPGDNFDPETSHVVPALIRKCVHAVETGMPSIQAWGTGSPSREFLYVEDAAEGVIRAAERVSEPTPINLGTGEEIRIADLASLVAELTGFRGQILWDADRPDGQPRRCLELSRARQMLDWRADTDLRSGLSRTVRWWREQPSERD